jgi:hypothetical protein
MRNQQIFHAESVCKLRKLPSEGSRDFMHGYTTADIEADRAQVAMFGSLCRVIAGAPVQNKLVVFGMMARDAAENAAAHRQQAIDELWEVATSLGLVDLFGITGVQDVLAAAFAGDAS